MHRVFNAQRVGMVSAIGARVRRDDVVRCVDPAYPGEMLAHVGTERSLARATCQLS